MGRLALVVVSVVICAGCKEVDPAYCANPAHAGDPVCYDAPGNGGPCKDNSECTGMTSSPVCDLTDNGGTCVQCTASDHALCTGTTPLCENHSCTACVADNDCGTGGLCLPSGACAAPDNIIHAVASGGIDVSGCGGTGNACKLERALTEVNATKNVIKLDTQGTYTPETSNFVVATDVTIDARDATLHKKDNGPLLTISDNKTATLFGGTIEGATGTGGDGIRCGANATLGVYDTTIQMNDESGIDASSCTVTLSRSRLLSNKRGGLKVSDGRFVIVGNVFLNNGDSNSTAGGVLIAINGLDPMNRIDFNSISGNQTLLGGGNAPGVHCNAGAGFIARNNIIWGNNGNTEPQIGGSCKHTYSDIGMLTVGGVNDGGYNQSVDPMFTSDLHVMSTSIVRRSADPNAKLDGVAAKDIDGDPRIAPADIGADQLPRP